MKKFIFFIIPLIIPLIILILSLQSAYSMSLKELIARYYFSASAPQMNVTDYKDFMIDKNNNGVNDTLIFELTIDNSDGNFIFVINLDGENGVMTVEINKTLGRGVNKLNISYDSIFLSKSQFNYSIKIYNSSYAIIYRKDKVLSKKYLNYEEGFKILELKDFVDGKSLAFNITIDSSINGTFETALFLSYNSSVVFTKDIKSITNSTQKLMFVFDNETIKRTHYAGNFSVMSLKIGRKSIKTNFTTAIYNFKNFAAASYISNFTDAGVDIDNNGRYDLLQINAGLHIAKDGNYTISSALYDLSGSIIESKNLSYFLNRGDNILPFNFNGARIYEKKLEGQFIVKYMLLFDNGILADKISDAYQTKNYNFNDFDALPLPDLTARIEISDGWHYGIGNITVNFTFRNIGKAHAFNVFNEMLDNKTFSKINKYNILGVESGVYYQVNFTNVSDFEVTAAADSNDLIEESNETNNAERIIVRLNKRPSLMQVENITANETDKIAINLSASDINGDKLYFYINSTKLLNYSNEFIWDTDTTDAGNYTLMATASDGYLSDSKIFHITVNDAPEKDIDNDGINDSIDTLIGNENSVSTSTINLSIFVDDSHNLSKLFNEKAKVKLMDSNSTIAEFYFNFSIGKLNLTNIKINKQAENATGSLLIKGLKIPEGAAKTLYLDRINLSFNGICIKDEEITEINEIGNACSASSEYQIECDGTLQNYYKCTYNSTLSKYKIEGLKHSGIVQIDYRKTASEPGSPSAVPSSASKSSDSGGGGVSGVLEMGDGIDSVIHIHDDEKIKKVNAVNVIVPINFEGNPINKIKEGIPSKNINKITGQVIGVNSKEAMLPDTVNLLAIILLAGVFCFFMIKLRNLKK